ncbi:helix-turn-helix domain-containing protein [Streptacidiphilus sp. EB129]|uniref:helix-turn-helix domain-containing protein n=1 Tax=Streptacidiphilus sp. EB129 TaxID=3156262 RepID=UPI003514461D
MPRTDPKKATAARLREVATREHWSSWQLSGAIGEQCSVGLLQAHRLARGWTLEDAVAKFVQICVHTGVRDAKLTVQQLSAFETGRSTPGAANLDRLCRLYATRPDRLGFGNDYTLSDAVIGDDEVRPLAADPSRPLHTGRTEPSLEEKAKRSSRRAILRGLLAHAGASLSMGVLDALADVRLSMADTLESATVGETTIEQLERSATEYGHAYQMSPPLTLLSESVQDFLDVHALLERRQSSDMRTRLCRVAAQLAGTAGIALVALGEHREARAWFRTAQVAADETGDRALRAWLFAREAVIPFYFGTPHAALELAERARLVAGKTPCSAAAWAPSLEARSLARLGRLADAEAAMRLARNAFARLPADQIGDTAYGYTERQLRWHEGSMYTVLGDTRRVQGPLEAAWGLYSPAEHLDRALIGFDQATCLLRVGEIGIACQAAERILDHVPREHLTGIVVTRARDLLAAVPNRGARLPAVRQLRELVAVGAAAQ